MTSLQLAVGSILVGIAVLALKTLAWWITGSVALLSDAVESTVNVATAFAALLAVRVAARPPDATHPYGHHKAEFLSAILEGVLIVFAALLILKEAYVGFQSPIAPEAPIPGLLVNFGATLVNAIWARVLVTNGRRLRSPALTADGQHLFADVVTSAGVAVGILLALATGWWFLDPLLAATVAVHILWAGIGIIRRSMSGLMDETAPEETLARIRGIIAAEFTGEMEAHDLRTRQAGPALFIDFHLVVPGRTSVFEAHERCDRIEAALRAAFEDARVTIHVEPEHKAKPDEAILSP